MVRTLLEFADGGVESCREGDLEVKAVGIGAAGFILRSRGLLVESPNIDWSMVPLGDLVRERTGLPVFIDNDANAAAAGERLAGVARCVDDFVCLTIGTGIGGGAFVGGEAFHGHRWAAAEFGHMTIDPSGPECGCGRRGCLEALASGTALQRSAISLAREDPGSILHEQSVSHPEQVTGEAVSRAAERGDPAALAAFAAASYYLGLGIVNLVLIFDPEMVVLGGGVSRSGHLLLEEVRRVVAKCGITALVRDVDIVLSTLGNDAGTIGAAAIAWEGMGRPQAK
jgi:glucokinase